MRSVLLLCIFAILGYLPLAAGQCDTASGWQEFNGFCYKASQNSISENVGWHDARTLCSVESADLASINTQAAQDFVADLLNESPSTLDKFWIGYTSLESKGQQFSWTDGTLGLFTAWADSQPETTDDVRMCVYADKNNQGLWYNDNCGYTFGMAVLCKHPLDGEAPPIEPTALLPSYCPAGYFDVGNKCYRVFLNADSVDNGSSWYEAKEFCRSQPGHYPDLASIHSPADNAAITAQLNSRSWSLWIGYYLDYGHNIWLWSDQSLPNYENWADAPVHARDYCIEMIVNPEPAGVWYSLHCGDKRGFVCQTYKDPNALITTPPPTQPHSCPIGWTPYWYGCYMVRTQPAPWQQAEDDCVAQGGHLASVGASAENAALYAGADGNLPMWIGLRRSFSGVSFEWSDGLPDFYSNFASGSPGLDDCVMMANDESWVDTSCSLIYPYICKMTQGPVPTTPVYVEGECPGEDWVEWGQYCYLAVSSYVQYEVAEQACQQEGAHLASVHSFQENELVFELLQNTFVDGWIGLYKESTGDGPYMWTDGTPFDYELWGMGEPNNPLTEHCVHMYTASGILNLIKLWNNAPCFEQHSYVCKYDKGPARNNSSVQPQYFVELNQTFSSSSGEDFTPTCIQAYAGQMSSNTQTMQSQVNDLIGGQLCAGLTQEMIRVLLTSSPMIITGSLGSTSPLFFLKTAPDMSLGEVHNCVAEITGYLSLYTNWPGGAVLSPESGCPNATFAGQSLNTSDNAYVCVGDSSATGIDYSLQEAFLNYGVSHIGQFVTQSGEDLSIQCLNEYNRDFAQVALTKASEVNDLIQGGSLCSGNDVRINSISPLFLTSNGDQGTTSQRYLLQGGSAATFHQIVACGEELSFYLGDHGNWADPVLPPPTSCPAITFTPQMFLEAGQEWVCDQSEAFVSAEESTNYLKPVPQTLKVETDKRQGIKVPQVGNDIEVMNGHFENEENIETDVIVEKSASLKKVKKDETLEKKHLQEILENTLLKHHN